MKKVIYEVDPKSSLRILPKRKRKKVVFIVICSDVVPDALELVQTLHEEEDKAISVTAV
jgi:hypothetical protein